MGNTEELKDNLDQFLGEDEPKENDSCSTNECKCKCKDGLIERVKINKQIIVEDGRQLLL